MSGQSPRTTGGVSYKQGIVSESKPGFARVEFDDLDGLVTDWLPVLYMKTFSDKAVWTLDIGEHVACLLDEYMENGCILGACYSEADVPPVSNTDKFRIQFKDGGSFEYDRSDGSMNMVCKGIANLTAGGNVTVKAPSVMVDTPQMTCTGKLTVAGLLTYQGGMAGSGGTGGAAAVISGPVQVQNGSVTADGIDLKTHRHTGVQSGSGSTDVPI